MGRARGRAYAIDSD
nr:hypothetical protein [Tanacetum cinerariifolium]